MTQAIFEAMGGSYMEVNGFRIPCLLSLSDGQQTIGVWGQRHLRYIQEHRRATYISLKTTGKLNNYLAAGSANGRMRRCYGEVERGCPDGVGTEDEQYS